MFEKYVKHDDYMSKNKARTKYKRSNSASNRKCEVLFCMFDLFEIGFGLYVLLVGVCVCVYYICAVHILHIFDIKIKQHHECIYRHTYIYILYICVHVSCLFARFFHSSLTHLNCSVMPNCLFSLLNINTTN